MAKKRSDRSGEKLSLNKETIKNLNVRSAVKAGAGGITSLAELCPSDEGKTCHSLQCSVGSGGHSLPTIV